jgi:ferric-dicitrate binding protein FerR (iron transport regulator)
MQNTDHIVYLLRKHLREELSVEETLELETWLNENQFNHKFLDELTEEDLKAYITPRADWAKVWDKMVTETKVVSMPKRSSTWKYLAAASVFLCIASAALYWYKSGNKAENTDTAKLVKSYKNDILPNSNVTLTLADGSVVDLNKRTGVIAQQNGITITNQEAQLVYDAGNAPAHYNHSTLSWNSVSIRGGLYQLVLPDGSRVWLNSSSALRFPVSFVGKQRNVELTGEGYFEVTKDTKPFIVSIRSLSGEEQGSVQVLGTHFNIQDYENENSIKTTLFEGSVKISNANGEKLLTPGKQAEISRSGDIQLFQNVDLDEVLAWKNNEFQFHDLDIKSIMRQVQRYYDAEIVYEGKVTTERYTGVISRSVPASDLLELLQKSGGVHFEIEKNKIIVKP